MTMLVSCFGDENVHKNNWGCASQGLIEALLTVTMLMVYLVRVLEYGTNWVGFYSMC